MAGPATRERVMGNVFSSIPVASSPRRSSDGTIDWPAGPPMARPTPTINDESPTPHAT